MAYCGPLGIPLSFFEGLTRRPKWDLRSRCAAEAHRRREASRCTECGFVHAEGWTRFDDDGNEIEVDPRNRPMQIAVRHCPAKRDLQVQQKADAALLERPGKYSQWVPTEFFGGG